MIEILTSTGPMRLCCLAILLVVECLTLVGACLGQDNYEIQVYGADLVPPHSAMLELHTNFTAEGSKTVMHGVQPTEQAGHETIEISRGVNEWLETGV